MNTNVQTNSVTNNYIKASISELLAHWRIQESLFQGYRRLFLTLETILLSIAALSVSSNITNSSVLIVLASLFVVGIAAAFIFIPMISKRGELVFYWQAKILKAERGESVFTPLKEMKEFQHDQNYYFRKDKDFCGLKEGKHVVRNKLNFILPVIILVTWIFLGIAFMAK